MTEPLVDNGPGYMDTGKVLWGRQKVALGQGRGKPSLTLWLWRHLEATSHAYAYV